MFVFIIKIEKNPQNKKKRKETEKFIINSLHYKTTPPSDHQSPFLLCVCAPYDVLGGRNNKFPPQQFYQIKSK